MSESEWNIYITLSELIDEFGIAVVLDTLAQSTLERSEENMMTQTPIDDAWEDISKDLSEIYIPEILRN
jgi:H2-forming N5,N10-methylenetetrahydromethanopterin dehydrogenase-like enzyme